MELSIDDMGVRRSVCAEAGDTILDVLQRERVRIQATCGGAGTCGRCQVLVRDAEGVGYRLACATPAAAGMEVVAERICELEVVQSGRACTFPADRGSTGFGMAIDIGTTTVVACLYDLASGERMASAGCPNPQIAFGSDVISRISASVDGKLDLMTSALSEALVGLRARLADRAGIGEGQIGRISIAGNTVMQHIAAGMKPDSIGVSPFTPLTLFGGREEVPGFGPCRFARCIAGYVGGDITAGLLARGIDGSASRLFIDLGTNGEMALAHRGRIVCCATAAGPVFEGANVRFGMPASRGAISKVTFDGNAVNVEVVGDAQPIGVCGTGLIDAVALMLRLGIVEETGRMLGPDELEGALAALVGREGRENAFYLVADHSVYITQDDVRKLQLAKAAVCAGILTLLETAGASAGDVESLDIAGGFGRFLSMQSAADIGLVPRELAGRASSVGNTSIEGAAALLVSGAAREREAALAQICDYLELSTSATFNSHYIEQMGFE